MRKIPEVSAVHLCQNCSKPFYRWKAWLWGWLLVEEFLPGRSFEYTYVMLRFWWAVCVFHATVTQRRGLNCKQRYERFKSHLKTCQGILTCYVFAQVMERREISYLPFQFCTTVLYRVGLLCALMLLKIQCSYLALLNGSHALGQWHSAGQREHLRSD